MPIGWRLVVVFQLTRGLFVWFYFYLRRTIAHSDGEETLPVAQYIILLTWPQSCFDFKVVGKNLTKKEIND